MVSAMSYLVANQRCTALFPPASALATPGHESVAEPPYLG